MGQHAIVEKLAAELRKPIRSERQVVYILVEVRKLLELTKRKNVYPALNFHCNWVVHTELSESNIAKKLVLFFEHVHQETAAMQPYPKEAEKIKNLQTEELIKLMGMATFRSELCKLLNQERLNSSLCTSRRRWVNFTSLYGEVIRDVPLTMKGLKYIDKIIVKAQLQRGRLTLEWTPEPPKMDGITDYHFLFNL